MTEKYLHEKVGGPSKDYPGRLLQVILCADDMSITEKPMCPTGWNDPADEMDQEH